MRASAQRAHRAAGRDVDLSGAPFRPPGKGRQGPLCPHRRTGPVLGAALPRDRAAPLRIDQDADVLFLSSVGTPICADWLCRKVRAYLRRAGIDKRGSCHLLRHSVATLMLEGGADIRYVAEMLGHARLETTQRYTRVSIDRLRTVHARCHPASGLDVAMASELCSMLPEGAAGLELSAGRRLIGSG